MPADGERATAAQQGGPPPSGPQRVDPTRLTKLVERTFAAQGVPPAEAATLADHLVLANLRGVDSHGVGRVGIYVDRLQRELVEPRANVCTLHETPVSALLDGGNGPGIVIADRAMRLAIDKARQSGIGMVSVRNSNHCGMLAYYTGTAARNGMVSLATTSAPASMAPWGAQAAFFGTNPLSYAIPTPTATPDIVFDMATSEVALGKIILADKGDREIPLGWALDPCGRPTRDAASAIRGTLLPLGGAKGSGLALFVEVVSALLSGANYGPHIPALYNNPDHEQGLGHFFLAFQPDLFLPPEEFASRIAQLASELRTLPAAQGHERVCLPGEPESEREAERRATGVPLTAETYAELRDVAARLGVAPEHLDVSSSGSAT